jgi:hypothetical protein
MRVWELHLAGCSSLKDKRRILKSLKDRLHNEFQVAVAETAHQDSWQRAELTCVTVASERRHVERVLQSADNLVAGHPLARIIDSMVTYR